MIVPIDRLLLDAGLRRIRPQFAARHCVALGVAAACVVAAALFATPARADWLGEVTDMMGTRVSVDLWADDELRGHDLVAQVMTYYRHVDEMMSTYKPDSEISRINAHAHEAPMRVSDELFDVVQASQEISAASHGAFDITYESIGYLYDFHARQHPTDAQIKEHLPAVSYRHVVLDAEKHTIYFTVPGVKINVGGIAKGYLVQHAADMLRAQGVEHALLNAGGDTRVIGDRRGQPWIVGIRNPRVAGEIVTRLPLVDEAISTAGDYERFFEENGRRYHHVINPRTGEPTEGILTVTVIGPSGTMTDGLDTAIFVLGVEEGMKLIKRYPEYETIIVESNGKVTYSSGLTPPEQK
ncbi:MAG: FAD:protein FMN transferase [Gammaproteobacteria bacterium]